MDRPANRIRLAALLLAVMLQSCAIGAQLGTESADRARITGTFTLLL